MQHKRTLGRQFWRLWSAVGISSVGDGMLVVALPLIALTLTRNPLAISGVLIAQLVPALFTALPVGALADRLNRRSMIVFIELARLATVSLVGSAVLVHRDSLLLLYGAGFLLGGLNMAFDVVCGASLPSIVKPEKLVRANGHLVNAETTAEDMIGQAAGGVAVAVTRSLPFFADAVSFVISAALLSKAVPDNDRAQTETSAWEDTRVGLRWFTRQPLLRLLAVVIGSLAFCQAIVLGILVLYARQNLHLGGTGYGLVLAVASLGLVVGGATAPRIHDRLGPGPMIIGAGLLAAAVYPVLATTHSAVVATAALSLEAAAIMSGNVAARSLRQQIVPAQMQGRATSAYTMVIRAAQPLGALVGGLLASAISIRFAFFSAFAIQLAVLALAGSPLVGRIREFMHPERPIDIRRRIIDLTSAATADPALGSPKVEPAVG